ncbi:hypothetical protein C8R46DRAFT_306160 [Mycena filopes]|nr:hypothetical protein C8R46DRAFT_306160 [Mycena filopes]
MAHLRRWPTPQSIYSDWTDSRPPGATISIHALAKPLSKFLYHRQAIGIIENNRGTPLSKETADILTTYLTFKNILPSTRALVLLHFSLRAASSELDAQVIVESDALGRFRDSFCRQTRPFYGQSATLSRRLLATTNSSPYCVVGLDSTRNWFRY